MFERGEPVELLEGGAGRLRAPAPARSRARWLAVGQFPAVNGLVALAIVVVLAFLNFAFDICVGCIMYAQLVRLGVLPLRRQSPAT